jgi:hypothetical protein
VANNQINSTYGGGVYATNYTDLTNCDIVNNAITYGSTSYGAGIYVSGNSNTMTNSVVWGNRWNGSASNISIVNNENNRLTTTYNAVEGGWPGTGNLFLGTVNTGEAWSPYFTSPTAGAGSELPGSDWSLQENSFLINRGNNSASYLSGHDIAGNERVQQERVDIGAYESPYASPFNLTPDANNIIHVTVEGAGTKADRPGRTRPTTSTRWSRWRATCHLSDGMGGRGCLQRRQHRL